jgi:hypothetical protein
LRCGRVVQRIQAGRKVLDDRLHAPRQTDPEVTVTDRLAQGGQPGRGCGQVLFSAKDAEKKLAGAEIRCYYFRK